jgi:hypothetical protein
MISKFMDAVFGCWHTHYSFPMTVRAGKRRSAGAVKTGTYVVCLDCGKELPYDWQEMRVVPPGELPARVVSLATKEAA